MTGAEFLLRCLRDQGLSHVFLVPGGHIDPLVAELGKGAGPQPIVAAHEEGAGFMADGYARVSGRFFVLRLAAAPACRELEAAPAMVLLEAPAIRPVLSMVLRAPTLGPLVRLGRGAFSALSSGDDRPPA